MTDVVVAVEAVTVQLPLPIVLEIAGARIEWRRYAVVEIRTEGGFSGCAISLTRNLPVATTVRAGIVPRLLGIEADADSASWREHHAVIGDASASPTWRRALSLVDVALWDVTARRRGSPLWQLLGGTARSVPLMLVGGYPRPGLTPDALGARVAGYLRAGFPLVKVARQGDPAIMARLLKGAVACGAPRDGIVVDAAWAWATPGAALRELRAWETDGFAWLEDPLAQPDAGSLAELRTAAGVAIGAGDDETDPRRLGSFVESKAVDVLRLDVTTIGGFTSARRVLEVADRAGVPVSTHVYPQIHIHAAVAFPACHWIETFDPVDNPFDPADRLWSGGVTLGAGLAAATEAPGLGTELDRELIEHHRIPDDM